MWWAYLSAIAPPVRCAGSGVVWILRVLGLRLQTTEKAIIRKEKHLEDDSEVDEDDEVIYKIEVAANRSADFVFVKESMLLEY
jgi:hypothetical protein